MMACAVIVAGGQSSRLGREKMFEMVGGRTILDRTIARLAGRTSRIALNANGDHCRLAHTGLEILADLHTDIGTPLAGLHAALTFGGRHGYEGVLTVPSDAPFLPDDLVSRLSDDVGQAAIAASAGQPHYLTGWWPTALLPALEEAIDQRLAPRLQDWVVLSRARLIEWPFEPYDPFFNVNTPKDLAEAQRIAAEFGA